MWRAVWNLKAINKPSPPNNLKKTISAFKTSNRRLVSLTIADQGTKVTAKPEHWEEEGHERF